MINQSPQLDGAIRPVPIPTCDLESLPGEIIDYVTYHLPARSTLALHCSSKILSNKVQLDDRFWRSRLCDGNLLLYIWDMNEQELKQRISGCSEWDWKALIRNFATNFSEGRQSCTAPSGLWNRRRILNRIEEILVDASTFSCEQSILPLLIRVSENHDMFASAYIPRILVSLAVVLAWALHRWTNREVLRSSGWW